MCRCFGFESAGIGCAPGRLLPCIVRKPAPPHSLPPAYLGTDAQGANFYRIIDRFIDQTGANTESIYGGAFKDDAGGLALKHDRKARTKGGWWRSLSAMQLPWRSSGSSGWPGLARGRLGAGGGRRAVRHSLPG